MSYKYPENILKMVRQSRELDPEDTSKDELFQMLKPEKVFEHVLNYEGIIGYNYTILNWIKDIFGISLDPEINFSDYKSDEKERKQQFVSGFGNMIRALPNGYDCDVTGMECDEKEIVTIHFKGGGTKKANIYADSLVAAMYDIIKQALL